MEKDHSDLLRRLTVMRAAVRRRLALYGLGVTAGGGLFALTLIVFLDWWLWLPPVLRFVVGAIFALGCVVVASHWVIRPLRARFMLGEMAGKLERHFPALGDSLTSTVNFLEAGAVGVDQPGPHGSSAMIRQVINETDRIVRHVPLEEALTRKPLLRCALIVLLACVGVAMIAWAAPGWYRTGLARYALPSSAGDWPRRVDIQPLQTDTKVSLGGALLVRMRITRGMDDDLRGIVRVREIGGETRTFAMQREEAADFYCTLESIVTDLVYWFEAGDADTADAPCRVTVVKPPAVTGATVRVVAPAYAQPRPAEERNLSGGEVRAVAGSTLTVSVRSSKGVGIDNQDEPTAHLEFDQSPPVPLRLENDDRTRLTGSFELREGDSFRIVLRGPDGFENSARRTHRLIATPDLPPSVTVVEPSVVTEITPAGSITLVARVEDDFGIRHVRLSGELRNRSQSIAVPLADNPPTTPTGTRVTAELRHVWDLTPLKLAAGDVLAYRVAVTDNYGYEGAAGQSTTSAPLRLKVISKTELENRLRDEFALLEARVRQALLDQEEMRDDVNALAETAMRSGPPNAPVEPSTPPPSDHAGRIGRQQLRLAGQLRRLAERFDRVREHVRLNHAFDEQARRQLADAARQLARTASGSMTRAALALDRLAEPRAASDDPSETRPGEAVGASARQEQVATVVAAQADAVDELQRVLRWMGRWGAVQEVVAKTRDLLDRQQRVRAAALRRGRSAVGKPVHSLTDEELAHLRRVVREQRQLAREMDQWLRRGRSLIQRMRDKNPTSAEALESAVRAAVAHRVLARMEQAAAALADNRTAAASIEQRGVESGLATALAALEARQVRELAALRKSVERMLDAVAELLHRQEQLLEAVQEAIRLAPASDALSGPADEQRAVRRNTEQLGEEISAKPPAVRAAGELKRAVAPMERAEQQLRASDGERAAAEQNEAVTALQTALEELQRLAAETEHQLMQKSLAQTRRKLEDIRGQQEAINKASSELVDAVAGQRRPGRAAARRASRLAARQFDVREQTDAVRRELETAAVYAWVLERVGDKMAASREALDARRLDAALSEVQRAIVSELSRLIDAITSIEALPPPDRFTDGGGAGGGATAKPQPPVPPVAELIVIKIMQEALNEETIAIHTAIAGAEPTEDNLRRARIVGREQEQLRILTERVTREARSGD